MKKILSIIIFTWFLLSSVSVDAQVYNITSYSRESGLLQSQVMTVKQDSKGYLWLGTHRGIFRFDGKRFIPFSTNEGLVGKLVSDIVEGKDGSLWIGTSNGLSRFQGEEFINFTDKDGLTNNDIQVLLKTQNGDIWIGHSEGGIDIIKNDSLVEQNPFEWPAGNTSINVQALLEDKSGKIWIGTTDGLFIKNGGNTLTRVEKLPSNRAIFSLMEDVKGHVWIGTNQGVYEYTGDQYIHHDLIQADISDNQVFCLVATPENQVWMGTGKGIIRYEDGAFYAVEKDNPRLDYQIPSAAMDREGNIWFGTDGGGLRKLSDGIFEDFTKDNGLTSNLAKSFQEDRNGYIWISTRDRGINVFDQNQGRVIRTYSVDNGLGGNAICSSFEDSKGNFWFASYNGTLTRYSNGRFDVFDNKNGLDCNAVFIVGEDDEGIIWAGTNNGIFLIKGNNIIRHIHTQNDQLIDNTIYSIQRTPDGKIWIGTSQGVSIYDHGSFTNIENDEQNIGTNVFTLIRDKKGRVWSGSSVGLSVFDEGSFKHVRISGAEGAHTVVALIIEADRYLWIGTENGVYRLDLDNYNYSDGDRPKFDHFTDKDGLPSMESNANAAFLDSDGNTWLGTALGAIRKPKGLERDEQDYSPLLYITEARAKEKNWAQFTGKLEFKPTENDFEFDWIGISLSNPQQIEYKYSLSEPGKEKEWSGSTRQTQIIFGNLSPGKYEFTVRAKKESTLWEDAAETSFGFTILPPFWQRWWFILLMVLLAAGIGFLIYNMITNRRKQAREEQKIRDTAEKLQLEHQALYAMMNPHFTFNALQSIQYFIHRQDKISANKFLSSFAKLIRKNLESTKSDFITLSEEVERLRLYLSLEKMRFPEKFDYEVNVEPNLEVHDTLIPPMIFQPFVENSIKHGIMPLDANGIIQVNLASHGEDHMKITIEDNGIGIEASKKQKINRPNDHVSKGMQITLDRLALFARMTGKKYALDIREILDENGAVAGTMVEMILPVKESLI